MGSTDSAIALVLRLANSLCSAEVRPSSVVHTGVKSAGWLKKTAHDPFFQSWNEISPSVVSAVKSGAVSPRCKLMSDPFVGPMGDQLDLIVRTQPYCTDNSNNPARPVIFPARSG